MKNMAKPRELTHKEIKMINDLLDGQLSSEKAKQAFLQIERDAALRVAYDKLRWTKSLLRQAPRRRVPHNFTLTRQMAQEATGFYKLRRQTFSIAGTLASFLFIVLLAVQLVPFGLRAATSTKDMENEISMMEDVAAPEVMMEQVEEEPEMLAMEAEVVEEEMAEMPAEDMADASAMEAEEEQQPESTLSPEEATGGGAVAGDDEELVEERMPEPEAKEETAVDEETIQEEGIVGGTIEEELPELSEEIVPEEPKIEEEDQTDSKPLRFPKDWLFLATVISGLLAFIFFFISIRERNRS